MGCNDSKSLKKDFNQSKFSKTTTNDSYYRNKDRRDDSYQQNKLGKTSRLTPFYEELEQLYQSCNKDLRKFIMTIEERVSEIYMEISREILSDMNHDEIAAQQSKIIISEEILSLNLNILKVIGRTRNFQYDKETFKSLNKFQNNLVGYLKTKYPRGQQTFVSGDLMNHFKEFDRVNDLEYDILKNSNTYFGNPDSQTIVKGIKLFINKLMKQCDIYFPEFEKLMQDRAFFIKNEKGEKVSLNFKIGRKIPENIPKYEKFDTGVLEVTSPQIFRVLIKWMEDLEQTIMKTSEKISKKQNFKCYVGEKPTNPNPISLQIDKNEKELLFDYINEYEYSEIVEKLVPKIQDLKPKLQKKNQAFIDQLDEFNERLLKILNQADPRQRYVPTKEIETIKYSSFNAKFVEFILTQKLVYTIKELIKVGQFFISEYMMNLDIIKFRVTDLMRCQVSGNKKEILQVYKNFQKLEEEDKIEIIKIKNRLSTPLNDAMLIFVIKNSWIICEAQLILSDTGDKADKKSKNTELVNHYFYQLERSPYGIMAEIAVLLTYKDSKISYENKITFHESDVDIERCKQKHPKSVSEREEQNTPFICSKCSGFYSKFQNLFKLYKCNACRITICSKCILRKNPQLQTSFIMGDITRELQQKIQALEKGKKDKRQVNKQIMMAKEDKSQKSTAKKLSPKSILSMFYQEKIKMKEKFEGANKKQGIRKVKVQKMIEVFQNEFDIDRSQQGCYFVYVNFLKGQAGFKLYYYDAKYREIQNTFDLKEKYDQNSNFSYSDYDLFMVLDKYNDYEQQETIKDKHVFLWGTRKEFQAKISQVKKLTAEGKIAKVDKYQVISVQIKDSSSELVLNYAPDNSKKDGNRFGEGNQYDHYAIQIQEKKDFKYQSLAVLVDRLPALKSARGTIEFDDLGIETIHLDYFRTLSWRHSIKELKITDNKIQDVNPILDNLNSLQRLYFNANCVKELRFIKPLPNLQILNGSQNEIASIQGLNNILNIRKLLLSNNKLKDFPKCRDLKLLNILNLGQNYLSNIENILKADFPQIQQLIISGQYKEQKKNNQSSQQNESHAKKEGGGLFGLFGLNSQKQSEMVVKYPKLKNFQSYQNEDMFSGREIQFYSDSLQKISLGRCSIDRIIFQRRQSLQNLKYLHLAGNKIKYFSFLSVTGQMRHRKMKDSSVNSEIENDNKPISNESLIELNLSSNQIEYLPVMKFTVLKKLQLQENNIKDIKQLKLSKMPELQQLYLGGNCFTQMYELFLPKLKVLSLENLKELRKTNIIFTNSQMPVLEELSLSRTSLTDFSFNLNPKTNPNYQLKLKSLRFHATTFENNDKMNTEFNIPTLQLLKLNSIFLRYFPILNLPKVKSLQLYLSRAQNFKNLESSKLPSLTSLTLNQLQESNIGNPLPNPNDVDHKGNQKQVIQTANINKCLTCAFPFPQLKDLTIISSKIGSLKGLESQAYTRLDSIQLVDVKTLDNKIPRINAPNATYMKCNYLSLPNCDILFSKDLTRLKRLELDSNQIESISDNTLSSLTELTTLSLNENKIKKFSCSKNLDKLTSLSLNYNLLTSFPKIKCKRLADIEWEGNKFTDLSELQNCQLPALESINFRGSDFSKSGLPKLNLPGLEVLRIVSCKLVNVSNLAKSHLPALRSLDLSQNEIQIFPAINFSQLDELSLTGNKLRDFKFLKHSNLEGLNTLRLSQNWSHEIIPLHQYPHLKILECSKAEFQSLPALDLPQIEQITVQFAMLQDISRFAQNEYKFLKNLNLSNNRIKILPKMYVQSLTDLIMDKNLLEDVSDFFDSDVPLTDLACISFQNNKLKSIPNIIFPNIEVLVLGSNPLTEFRALTLMEYPKLASLYLNHTEIEKVTLPRLPELEMLTISDSKISDLNWLVNAAAFLPKLDSFEAQNCKLTRIPNLQQIVSLTSINLQRNPIANVDGLLSGLETKTLKYLTIDLDVGSSFEKVKAKITSKLGNSTVGNYQDYSKNKAIQ